MNAFLPARVAQYASIFEANATAEMTGALLAAVCDRETLCGTAKALDQPGPTGRGDAVPRNAAGRWKMAFPPDGRGWGHGLMQIDYGSHAGWCQQKFSDADGAPFLWEIPEENIKRGAAIIAVNLKAFASSPWRLPAAICAYNAGQGAAQHVLGALAGLSVDEKAAIAALDKVTTGEDYVSDVLSRKEKFS